MPPIIHFGTNAASKAGTEAKRLNCKKALLVTDAVLVKMGMVSSVIDSLSSEGIEFEMFDAVASEPTLSLVDEGLQTLRERNCDLLVGVGGGSPIDTAKAISIMATNPGQFTDYKGFDRFPFSGLPVIAVPTTAGTGSEATMNAVITDTEQNIKMSIASPYLIPKAALVDPLLTAGLPKSLVASTGLDALTHAIEAYVSPKAQPMTNTLALSAIELLSKFLPRAWSNPQDLEARTKTLFGSLQAGIAFTNSSIGLVHGMARPLGIYFHLSHGLTNACLLGVVMEFCLQGNPDLYATIARAMGVNTSNLSPLKAAEAGTEKVKELVRKLEVPTLSGLGVDVPRLQEYALEMADDAISTGAAANSPRIAKPEEIVKLYMEAY
jgi:alcohol dehydrogenase